jgi:pyridoxal phosphate enzyme (YggS family)
MIETVDSFKLAKALNQHLETLQRRADVLVQVNIAQDDSKSGISEDEAEELLARLKELPRISVCGLMTIPPFVVDPELSRPHFRKLRLLAERLSAKGVFAEGRRHELSMGMSDDFTVAIEEGATIVRIGTAIFGKRTA